MRWISQASGKVQSIPNVWPKRWFIDARSPNPNNFATTLFFMSLFCFFFFSHSGKSRQGLTLRLPAVDDCTLTISTSELADLHRAVNLLGKLLTYVNLDGLGDEGRKGKRKSESRFVKTPFKL